MALLGHRLALVAIADDDERNDGEDDEADDAGDHEDRPLQIVDALCILARRLPRVLRCIPSAPGEQDQACDGDTSRTGDPP